MPGVIAPEVGDVMETVDELVGVIKKARSPFALYPIPAI
jgi:hypothetical protein